MVEERRQSPRRNATLHVQIETDAGRTTAAITQDLSEVGLLVLSHQALELGMGVTVYVLAESKQYVVSGKVVRQERADQVATWRYKAAVAIDPKQQPDLDKILAAIANAPLQ